MKMTHPFFLLLLWAFGGKSQTLEWARVINGFNDKREVHAMAVSPLGRIALAGYISNNNLPFDNGIFVYVLDTSGIVLWGDTISAKPNCILGGLSFGNENLYLGLNYSDSCYINNALILGKSAVLYYDQNGITVDVRSFSQGPLHDIFATAANDFFALITVRDTFQFYSHQFVPTRVSDIVVSRIKNGTLVFHKILSGNSTGHQLEISEAGNIYVFGGQQFDTLFFENSFFPRANMDSGGTFVMKMDSLGGLKSFSHACDAAYCAATDFAVGPTEKVVVAGYGSHYYGRDIASTFDDKGKQFVPLGEFKGDWGPAVDISDDNGFWAFVNETNYKGQYWANPDSIWLNQALLKIGFNVKVILRDTFAIPGGSRAIATDKSGAVYVTSSIPAGQTQVIHNISLPAPNNQSVLYVAKFHDPSYYLEVKETKEEDLNISVYPNPATDWLTFETLETTVIRLYDVDGREVSGFELQPGKTSINTMSYENGFYAITATSSKRHRHFKIVLE